MNSAKPSNAIFFKSALLPDGWAKDVLILWDEAGAITKVESDVAAPANMTIMEIGLPGMANVHSHAFQRAMAGLGEHAGPGRDDFWSWRELMYQFVHRITPDQMEAIAAFAYCEMVEAGFTSLGEFHYLHNLPDGTAYDDPGEMAHRIVAAASKSGIGLTLLPVFYAHSDFGGAPLENRQGRFGSDLDGFSRLLASASEAVNALPHGQIGVAPHSLRAVTESELDALLSDQHSGPVHIHVAEQKKEVESCIEFCGQRPVEHLMEIQDLDNRWCLIHATHMTEKEVTELAGTEASVGLCPITEANLGDGLFAAPGYLEAGGQIGIGSDSNVRICAAEELRTLEYGQRLDKQSRTILAASPFSTGRTLYEETLVGGHSALNRPAGCLKVGYLADIVALDASAPALVGKTGDAILDSWIFCGDRSLIDSVWIAGARHVEAGQHLSRESLSHRFSKAIKELML